MFRHFYRIFNPQCIAIIGATSKQDKVGNILLGNLTSGGYSGAVVPVNPKYGKIGALKCYHKVKDIAAAIDLAVVVTPAHTLLQIAKDCGQAAIPGVLIMAPDPEKIDVSLEKELLDIAQQYKFRILGPNSIGFIHTGQKIHLSSSTSPVLPGKIALISQSSSLCHSVLDWAIERRVGFSYFVSIGGFMDIGFAELIDFFGEDPNTSCILIYMESIKDPRRFMSAARACGHNKPIVILKSGRTKTAEHLIQQFRSTEVGAFAAYEAAFRRAGIIQVETIAQLFHCAQALASHWRPTGNRLAIISNSAGPALIALDHLLGRNGQTPSWQPTFLRQFEKRHPFLEVRQGVINIQPGSEISIFQEALEACLQDADTDGILVVFTPHRLSDSTAAAQSLAQAALKSKKMIMGVWMGEKQVKQGREVLEMNGIPHYRYPESAVDVFIKLYAHSYNLQLLRQTPPEIPGDFLPSRLDATIILEAAWQNKQFFLPEPLCEKLLETYELGRLHTATFHFPDLRIGMVTDPVFGPLIHFGIGGDLAKVATGIHYGLPPLNMALAHRIMEQAHVYQNLSDNTKQELAFLLCKLSYLVMDFPQIAEITIDLHPVHPSPALVRLKEVFLQPGTFRHLVISPYPSQYIKPATLNDGTPVLLRPIKAEDEPLEARMFDYLSSETLYFRFFSYIKGKPTHDFLARFTQIDYDREMAIVAELDHEGKKDLAGVVRIVADAWGESAEYAIVVADPWQGKGLGNLLTDYIFEIAREKKLQKIFATVLTTNQAMVAMFKKRGFTFKLEDLNVYRVEYNLNS